MDASGGWTGWTGGRRPRRAARRRVPAVLATLLALGALGVLGAGCADEQASGPPAGGPSPDEPVGTAPGPGDPAPGPVVWERVTPVPGAVAVRRRPFDHAVPADGDRALLVRWWGGVAPCDVLAGVDVVETPTTVEVTLRTGAAPGAGQVACIEIAKAYEALVPLAAPLGSRRVVDGGG